MIWRGAGQQTTGGIAGEPWLSTVVVAEDELDEALAFEAAMHTAAGWTVTTNASTRVVVARRVFSDRGTIVRTLWFEAFDPASDGAES